MSKVKIVIDKQKCSGMGMCVFRAPDIFDQSAEDGKVFVKQNASVSDNMEALRDAILDCPTQSLSLGDKEELA